MDVTPGRMAESIEPTIAAVTVVPPPLREPLYTLVTKNRDECDQCLCEGCGGFVAVVRGFTSFRDLVDHANRARGVTHPARRR